MDEQKPTVEKPKVEEPKVEEVKVEEPKVEEPKVEEVKAEKPKVEKPKVDNNDDIFITESDTFEIDVEYYLDDLREPVIKDFDEEYEGTDKKTHSFNMTFKYPSQKDTEYIMNSRPIQSIEDAQFADFIELENVRLMTLVRSWTMERPLTDMAQLHPKIVKALRAKVSEKIAGNGLF